LARALESVRAQTVAAFEHIVVDDGSDDGSADLCRRLGDPRIRVLRFDRRRGANAARNAGLAMARAPVVTFLDSDDEYLPHRLEHVLGILAAEPDVDLVLSSFRYQRDDTATASINRDQRRDGVWLEELLMWHALYLGGTSITLRRDVARRFPWAEGLQRMQDRELLLHLAVGHRIGDMSGWARITATLDWTKHESTDSISAPAIGFVRAIGDLMQRHPDLMARHGLAVRYQIARHLKTRPAAGRHVRRRHPRERPRTGVPLRSGVPRGGLLAGPRHPPADDPRRHGGHRPARDRGPARPARRRPGRLTPRFPPPLEELPPCTTPPPRSPPS
jgi:hypothetical protein